jgi:two-component system, chemotaxis family, chemotaxis protein CheY
MADIDLKALKVLVVEDHPSLALILEKMLVSIGFDEKNVFKAKNGQEAFLSFKKIKMDLILTDWNMPVMDGVDFVRAIRRLDPYVPIIMETSKNRKAEVAFAKEAGISGYLVKPFQTAVLKAKVEEVLGIV